MTLVDRRVLAVAWARCTDPQICTAICQNMAGSLSGATLSCDQLRHRPWIFTTHINPFALTR